MSVGVSALNKTQVILGELCCCQQCESTNILSCFKSTLVHSSMLISAFVPGRKVRSAHIFNAHEMINPVQQYLRL